MKIFFALSLLILATVFSNCNETKKVIENSGSHQLTGSFYVTELNGVKINKDEGMSFEISEPNKSIRGTSGCNSFFGALTKDGNSLRISEMGISEMYCDEVIMKSEQSLMRAFNATVSYMLKKQKLSLYSDTDKKIILIAVKDTIQ